jgi:hypothetical protein
MPLSNLSPEQISATVTLAQIPYFDEQEFDALSLEQLQAFTEDQLSAMTESQSAAFVRVLGQFTQQ